MVTDFQFVVLLARKDKLKTAVTVKITHCYAKRNFIGKCYDDGIIIFILIMTDGQVSAS